jgi:DNA-directed RNA polymerase subunit H (RpoH/RPB5)
LHDTAIEAVSALTHLQRHTETVPTTQILSESTNTKIFKRTDTCQEELLEVTQENDTAYKLRVQAECLNSWKKNISG